MTADVVAGESKKLITIGELGAFVPTHFAQPAAIELATESLKIAAVWRLLALLFERLSTTFIRILLVLNFGVIACVKTSAPYVFWGIVSSKGIKALVLKKSL